MTKPKISKKVIDTLFQEISRGVPVKYACPIAGISRETYYSWQGKKVDESDENYELYQEFREKTEEAKALAVASRVEKIRIDPSWQAAAWWLERVDYEHFGKKQSIDANVDAKVKSEDISKLFDSAKVLKILDEESDN